MSQTYSIACKDCRKHLWIAQTSASNHRLYSGNATVMDLLRDFLFEHKGHNLTFDENCEGEIGDFEEIEHRADADD